MAMVVQHNLSSMNASRNLGITTGSLSKSTEKLSSGYKINRAGDNAAGLAISEKMRGQIRGLNQASANSEDGISMIQTAEGALNETHSILQRMRELAVQATNDTNTDDDRTQIQNEIDQLTQEVDRIATTTEFNTRKLLDGSRVGSVSEKAGRANVDATFGNSMVSAKISQDGSAKEDFTDIIRIEITKDFTEGQSTKGTPKLSDGEIDKINSMITAASAVTLDPVLQETTGISITNSGYNANNSVEENIKGALSAAKTELSNQVGALNKSTSDVSENNLQLEEQVKDVFKLAKDTKAASGKTFIKDGVTQDDMKEAIQSYVSALKASGSTSGKSNDIAAAKTKLENLFNSGTEALGGTISADVILEAKDGAGTAANSTIDKGEFASGKKIDDAAAEVKTKVLAYAVTLAGAEIKNDVNQAKVDQVQGVVDTLSNKDLSKAIVEYKDAVSKKTTVDANASSTSAKRAEAQEAVDAAKVTLDKLNTAERALTVTDLYGSTDDAKKFSIDSSVAKDGTLNVTLKNAKGDDTIITISNADKLKAGDVITITSEKYVESKQAATGKEAFRLQVGANAGQEVALGINSMKASDLEIVQTKEGSEGKALSVTNQASASLAVNAYDMAIQKVSTERAKMGAMQNRLEHTISNLDTSAENLQSAESRIRDTDMAEEMTNYSKSNILMQAGQS
ncbi:MAG: flagellin, partial [Clostridiales bacterium]|nr:flagellin [Clostridiales bacterium]